MAYGLRDGGYETDIRNCFTFDLTEACVGAPAAAMTQQFFRTAAATRSHYLVERTCSLLPTAKTGVYKSNAEWVSLDIPGP